MWSVNEESRLRRYKEQGLIRSVYKRSNRGSVERRALRGRPVARWKDCITVDMKEKSRFTWKRERSRWRWLIRNSDPV